MVTLPDNSSVVEKVSVTSCCIPLLGSCFGVGTILAVYTVTELPPGIHTPPISLLGCQQPEHTIYQLGFSVTGLLLGYCVLILFRNHFYLQIQEYSPLLALSGWIGGIMAVVGVTGQGIITLHPDFLQNIKPGGIGMTQQDRLHQQLALVFFVGAALHTYSTCWFAYRGIPSNEKMESDLSNASPTSGSPISLPAKQPLFSTTSRHLKTACVAVSLLAAPIAEMYHPTRLKNDTGENGIAPVNNKRIVNVIGLTQYVAVGAYIVFFGSYSLDLFQLRQRLQQLQQTRTGKRKDE
ncbi:Frag1/DRAM/Sfk1 family protein [Nitzschia inconspicua]|uniref:Frag1/DRAM/Sfk1 family protein n=1 Tax=Nitzschia inconspicua TaxID=303405 RepID=A0A9K3LC08_9STRA|nr:Frag1/DRAM/Sfk1 family protein [Nitzschia inconspicua]